MARLWRNNEETKEGKYLVKRRDGSIPEWPWFVLGAKDPCAHIALRAYANAAVDEGYDQQFVEDIFQLADDFQAYYRTHGEGDPDAPPHRKDDPATIAEMRKGKSA